jgi:hypothetical protein
VKRATKKPAKRVRISFTLPTETNETLREIARVADCTVDQVVTVILATRIVTERKAREVKA